MGNFVLSSMMSTLLPGDEDWDHATPVYSMDKSMEVLKKEDDYLSQVEMKALKRLVAEHGSIPASEEAAVPPCTLGTR